jgi:hypothetical protein
VNGGRSTRGGQTVRAWCRLSRRFLVKAGRSARRGRTVRAQRPDGPRLVQIVQTLPGEGRTVRAKRSDGPRLVQIVQPCWPCYLPYLQGAAQVLFDFLFLWPFVFPKWPLVSISFAVAGIVDVCH